MTSSPTANLAASPGRAYLLLGAVIVLWGVNWPIMKAGLGTIGPLWFASARVLTGALCLFAVLAFQGRLKIPGRPDLPILLSVGVFQVGITLGLMHSAVEYVSAGRSAILAYTTPLWVTPMAALILKERLTVARLTGLGLGLAGVILMVNPGTVNFSDPNAIKGNAMLLGAAISWACVIVHIRAHKWILSPLQMMPWQMTLGGAICAGGALLFESADRIVWSWELAAVLAYNGPIASAFCFWAMVSVSRGLPAVSTALGSLGVPLVGVVSSVWFLGERLSTADMVGLALIVLGVARIATADFRAARSPTV